MARPSIFGSTTSSIRSRRTRPAIRWYHFSSASWEKTLARLSMGISVADDAEGLQGTRAHPLGGGVRGGQLRVLRLQGAQLLHQTVVLAVGDLRVVQGVVAVVVIVDLLPELFGSLL